MLKIGTASAQPSKISLGKLKVARFEGQDITIPVRIVTGKKEGPIALITGGMHGDELNGIQLCQRFMHSLNVDKLLGTVIFLPVLNPSGFYIEQREVVYDEQDLNRAFNVKGKGISFTIAQTIMEEVVSKIDFGIDCHDANRESVLLPHPRVHLGKNKVCVGGCTLELGKIFGTELIAERTGKKGMLARAAKEKYDKPIITVEAGGGFVLWKEFLAQGLRGINNILKFYKMLPGKITLPEQQIVIPLEYRDFFVAEFDGMLNTFITLGELVHQGEILATVHDPIGERTQTIKSAKCGVLFSIQAPGKTEKDTPIGSVLDMNYCKIHKHQSQYAFDIIRNKATKNIKIVKNKYFPKSVLR